MNIYGGILLVRITLENITKTFGPVKAVQNLNLKVEDKEFLTLLGPSGCGKTTTLRIIAGLERQTEGNVYFDDVLVNDLPPKDRNVAMVFQTYALYPHMTVYDNIAFPLRIKKVSKDEIDKRVKSIAEMLQIRDLLNRKPHELSGGQQQRVALGRAIVRNPKVFLLDEPLSNLDAKLRVYMRAELKNLQRKLGVTTIYVTHDQVEAMSMSDRVAILMSGILQQVGTPSEIYDNPANVNVGGFIGNPPMNFFKGSIREDEGLIDFGDFTYTPKPEIFEILVREAKGSEVILGARPEHMIVLEKKDKNAIEGKIYLLEIVGESAILDLTIGDNMVKMRVPSSFKAEIGEKVYVGFQEDKIHFFDGKTEKVII